MAGEFNFPETGWSVTMTKKLKNHNSQILPDTTRDLFVYHMLQNHHTENNNMLDKQMRSLSHASLSHAKT